MSRSITSIPTSELSNLNFVDLDLEEMSTLAGGQAVKADADADVKADVDAKVYKVTSQRSASADTRSWPSLKHQADF